jgi:hypothetical protein
MNTSTSRTQWSNWSHFLGRVVTSERLERSNERKKRRLVGKFKGDRSQTWTFSFFFCIRVKPNFGQLFFSQKLKLDKNIQL